MSSVLSIIGSGMVIAGLGGLLGWGIYEAAVRFCSISRQRAFKKSRKEKKS